MEIGSVNIVNCFHFKLCHLKEFDVYMYMYEGDTVLGPGRTDRVN